MSEKDWQVVYNKRPRKKGFIMIPQESSKCFWNGFDEKGYEKWYVELKDGSWHPIKLTL